MIALLTNDERAGSHADQLAQIGGQPDRTYIIEDVRDYLSEIVRHGDVVAVSHPRVLGDGRMVARAARNIYNACGVICVGTMACDRYLQFLDLHYRTKWGVGTRKQTRGRPRKFDPPITEEQITDILSKWHNPAKPGKAGGYTQAQCAEYASALVGQDVTVANIKTLAKERVGHVRRYISKEGK